MGTKSLGLKIGCLLAGSGLLSGIPNDRPIWAQTELPSEEVTSPTAEPTSPLPIFIDSLLPALTPAELTTLNTETQTLLSSWIGWAGLDKVVQPPALPAELTEFRQAWGRVNPAIAPFLGYWHDDSDYPYSLSIFPTTTPGQVCILEFKPEWSLLLLNEETGEYTTKDVISEQILAFSIAIVSNGQLRSARLRSTPSAIVQTTVSDWQAHTAEFLGFLDVSSTIRVVAAQSVPTLPPEFPAELTAAVDQALTDHGCTAMVPQPSSQPQPQPNLNSHPNPSLKPATPSAP